MKRVEEKVKDIVEVRPFSSLRDFSVDPAQTLLAYHFTDITSDLMAKWLDAVSNVNAGVGKAAALAGFRGVGKSHFMAVFGAIVSRPELRSEITDQHIAARADRLSRRHNPVAFVRRGSKETLLEEVKDALAGLMNAQPWELSDSFNELLLKASEKAGEMPLVLLIDTAFGRDERVARDDGAFLSEIADAAKMLGIFVGLALDDDIAGADGANSSIAGNYSIDYLDQEHLYKVVDSHIFAKKDHALPLLHEIYKDFSAVLPGFRWSEQRFVSLYPLHPATLEIAPLIRLYLQDFAMLGFASEAGIRILGRPANSLIGLDEIYDAVEKKMRAVPDLDEAFAAFDKLDRDVVAKTPVHLRLPAKLILKGLFMLSLDGQGSTAANVAASMLIYSDGDAGSSSVDVPELLETFSTSLPEAIAKQTTGASEPKYCFKFASKDDITELLDETAADVPASAVTSVLLRHVSERFSDFGNITDALPTATACSIDWRGAIRHGEIVWDGVNYQAASERTGGFADWKVFVTFPNAERPNLEKSDQLTMEWLLGELREDDVQAIHRLYVLQNDPEIRESFGERIAAANHIHGLAVEKIWRRIFLSDARLVFRGTEMRFSDEARAAHTLSHLFTILLEPVLEKEYPSHPEFIFPLGVKETAKLTGQFFGGAAPKNSDIQKLAESFAFPLGLVELQHDGFFPLAAEALLELPFVKSTLAGLQIAGETVVTIEQLSSRLLAAPYGLTRESRHLVLAALVAQRQFEFVTFSGNRINHRSLDLQIIWEDIAGLARPFAEVYSSDRLRQWAVLISGKSGIKSLDRSEDRLVIIDALAEWLADWKTAQILEKFDNLPDESLNSSIWRTAANLRKTFGAVADLIESLVQNVMPLDQCVQNIADLFSDSEAEFQKKKSDLDVLSDFTHGAAKRDEIITYLSLCETTSDQTTEDLRRELLELTGSGYFGSNLATRARIDELWKDFKAQYLAHYIERHETVMNSPAAGERLEEILKSDRWSTFESFADLAWFDQNCASGAMNAIRTTRRPKCRANVAQLIEKRPFCSCSFSLALFDRRRDQPSRLETIIDQALSNFRIRLSANAKELSESVAAISDDKGRDAVGSLRKWLTESNGVDSFSTLTASEISLLRAAVEYSAKRLPDPTSSARTNRDELGTLLPNEVREWENEIDRLEIFAESKA